MTPEKLWAAIERYADEVVEYNTALRIDVGVDAASKNCLAAEKDLRALLAAALSSSPEPSAAPGAGWQPYTTAMGDAAEAYMRRFPNAHPLPAQFRWSELWRAMQSSGRCAYPQCDCEPPEHGGCGMAATREEERG